MEPLAGSPDQLASPGAPSTPLTPATPVPPATRASEAERDATARRLQEAFAERRIDDDEFDQRMRAALVARTRADLEALLADLPAAATGTVTATASGTVTASGPLVQIAGPRPGWYSLAYKNSVQRTGRWTVPGRYSTLVYKGSGLLDLRAAVLTAAVTTITAVAYKSDIDVLVPPGVRVEVSGPGVSTVGAGDELDGAVSAAAPVIHVRGLAYKGTITIRAKPPAR